MKIRIKGASVRLRLSKTDVSRLVQEGYLEELTPFPSGTFKYAVQKVESGKDLTASFGAGKITMHVPQPLIEDWDKNTLVTIEGNMPVGDGSLYLLLEKDFQCIDNTIEDQSDNYVNPNKTC